MKKIPPKTVWIIVFILSIQGLLVCLVGAFRSAPRIIWTGAGVMLLAFALEFAFYRCPYCGKWLGRLWMKRCPWCGKPLEEGLPEEDPDRPPIDAPVKKPEKDRPER